MGDGMGLKQQMHYRMALCVYWKLTGWGILEISFPIPPPLPALLSSPHLIGMLDFLWP